MGDLSVGTHGARNLDELTQRCRAHALPLTVQRRLVLENLYSRADHPTADQVFDDVRKEMPEISRTTVYRVLENFVRIGVARKVCHPGAAARYETETHRHHHLICLNCEKMLDLEDPSLDSLALPTADSGFHIRDYSIQFRGLCASCAAALSKKRMPTRLAATAKSSPKRIDRSRGQQPRVRH